VLYVLFFLQKNDLFLYLVEIFTPAAPHFSGGFS